MKNVQFYKFEILWRSLIFKCPQFRPHYNYCPKFKLAMNNILLKVVRYTFFVQKNQRCVILTVHGVERIPFLIRNAAAVMSSKVTTTGSSVSPVSDIGVFRLCFLWFLRGNAVACSLFFAVLLFLKSPSVSLEVIIVPGVGTTTSVT